MPLKESLPQETSDTLHWDAVNIESQTANLLGQHESIEEPIPPRRWSDQRSLLAWLKIVLKWVVVFAAYTTVILSLERVIQKRHAQPLYPGGDVNGIVPEFPLELKEIRLDTYELYTSNFTSEAASLEVRERWKKLFPVGLGIIDVPKSSGDYLLLPEHSKSGAGGYKLSWVHQLHCLYVLMDTYDEVIQYGRDGREPYSHVRHCIDYIRQGILCSLDVTLEGISFPGVEATGTNNTHVCRNFDQVMQYSEGLRQTDMWVIGFNETKHRIGNHGARPGLDGAHTPDETH